MVVNRACFQIQGFIFRLCLYFKWSIPTSGFATMTSRANNWSEAEVLYLISVWQERSVAEILDGKDRNNKAYEIMLETMKDAG